jgi:hypothetical protein
VSSDLTTRTSFRTFEVPRYDDVSSKRIPLGKPVTEAEGEYTSTEKLVKRNFSTTFSQTFPRNFVEKFVEIGVNDCRIDNAEFECRAKPP